MAKAEIVTVTVRNVVLTINEKQAQDLLDLIYFQRSGNDELGKVQVALTNAGFHTSLTRPDFCRQVI